MSLTSAFSSHLAALSLPPGRALVAVSGGPDSVALLDLLVGTQAEHRLGLIVAHLDHGIHPDSAKVAEAVGQLARGYGLEFVAGELALGPGTTETEARNRRYAWLEQTRRRLGAGYIITAHHADDQAETVLLRALHGTGPAGLAAMAERRGALVRPLLPFRHAELVAHVRNRGLPVWDDPANADITQLRAWLRHDVMPVVSRRMPEAGQNLERLARAAAEDRDAWDRLIDELEDLEWTAEPEGCSIAGAALAAYDSVLGAALVRAVARRAGLRLGGERSRRVLGFLLRGRSGSWIELGDHWLVELAFDRAWFVRRGAEAEVGPATIDLARGSLEWGGWTLCPSREPAPEAQPRKGPVAWFVPGTYGVRPWAAGDRIRPLHGSGGRLVVKCLQEARIPRHRRIRWPVVTSEAGRVVWVPGVCRSDELVPPSGTEALRVDAAIS